MWNRSASLLVDVFLSKENRLQPVPSASFLKPDKIQRIIYDRYVARLHVITLVHLLDNLFYFYIYFESNENKTRQLILES